MRTILLVLFVSIGAGQASAQGWAVFASGGKVYRVEAGGTPQQLHNGSAAHATWSVDGLYIYFIKSNGQIWRMYNDGSGATSVTSASNTNYNPIGAFRPDPEYVLYAEGSKFYKVNGATGDKTQIHNGSRNYVGECAINTAGTRMAARGSNSNLYKITVGGGSSQYSSACSSSISPNGNYVTANVSGHKQLKVHNWGSGVHKTLNAPSGKEWDNQKFAVNSNDYIVYKYDHEAAIGIVRVSNDRNTRVCSMGSDYPDFFVGNLPEVSQDNQPPSPSIDAPADGTGYAPGDSLAYAGSASDPEDGDLTGTALAWDLDVVGDGQDPVHTSPGESGSYTFPADITANTEYRLRLTATDSGGKSATTGITVWVQPQEVNSPPVISLIAAQPNPVEVGTPVTLSCTATDADADPLSYQWDLGDGTSETGAQVTHTYTAPGAFRISVEVSDGQGHTTSAEEVVSVIDPDMIVIEAEDMNLDGYEIEGIYIATFGTGTATEAFPGQTGSYRIKVIIIKENDGQPSLEVFIAGVSIHTIHYPAGGSGRDPESMDLGVYAISNGEEIKLQGTLHQGAAARVDKIMFQAEEISPEDGGEDVDAGQDASSDAGADTGQDPGADIGDSGQVDDHDEELAGSCGCDAAPASGLLALVPGFALLLRPRRRNSIPP